MVATEGTGGTGDSATRLVHGLSLETSVETDDAGRPAASIGRYVVLEVIGRGSMGRVMRAYDPKLQREVALKEVRRRALAVGGKARLVTEARAMAQVSHPNVVGVYDVQDDEDDELVIVMEYVAGVTLKAWLAPMKRPWAEVVEKFVAAGRGLGAAHAAGLLHRDFKPANVLVDKESGQVKVTDFGLAKGAGSLDASDVTSGAFQPVGDDDLTREGQVMGTPRYMAPEQHRGDPLTPAADQYALCVALWEALCGEAPFRGTDLWDQKLRGPSSWPRADVPRPIADAVMRGLAVEPSRRFPTVAELLVALDYDPKRRRNRWLTLAGIAAVGGAGVAAWRSLTPPARGDRCSGAQAQLQGVWDDGRRAEAESAVTEIGARYADSVWSRTAAELDTYAADWMAMHRETCLASTVRGEQSVTVMDLRMACLQRAKSELAAVSNLLAHADEEVVRNAHEIVGTLRPLTRCEDVEALQADVEPPAPHERDDVEAVRAALSESKVERKAGRFDDAQQSLSRAQSRAQGLAYAPIRAELALAQGLLLEEQGKYVEAEAALERALQSAARGRQWLAMADAANWLMYVVGYQLGRKEEGLRYRALAQGLSAGDPRLEGGALNNLAIVLRAQGEPAQAEGVHRRALGLIERTLGMGHPEVAMSRNNLAAVLLDQGKAEEAEAEFRQALQTLEQALGPDHPTVAGAYNNLATALHMRGAYEESERHFRKAATIWEAALSAEHPDLATSWHNLAFVMRAQGKYAEAQTQLQRALQLELTLLGAEHPEVAASRDSLARLLELQGQYPAAQEQRELALASLRGRLGEDAPEVAVARRALAQTLLAQGKAEPARVQAQLAWAQLDTDATAAQQRGLAAFVLARAHWDDAQSPADRTRARALAQRAEALLGSSEDEDASAEVADWLAAHPAP